MVTCSKCDTGNEESANFCVNCGAALYPIGEGERRTSGIVKEIKRIPDVIKNYPVLAAGASAWIPGLGQILCGEINRGVVFMAYPLLSTLLNMLITPIVRFGPLLTQIIVLVVRILAVYDAYWIATKLRGDRNAEL